MPEMPERLQEVLADFGFVTSRNERAESAARRLSPPLRPLRHLSRSMLRLGIKLMTPVSIRGFAKVREGADRDRR